MGFGALALICLVAISGPLLSLPRGVHVPVIIGELLVGLVLGDTGARLFHPGDPTFAFLAQIGFGLIMFVAGSHVPMREPALRSRAPVGLARAVAIGVLAVPAGLGIAHVFGTGHGVLYAVLLASSSASLVMPALAGLPLTAPSIVAMLPQLAVADAACIVLLPLAIDPSRVTRTALGALAVIAAAFVVFLALRWAESSGWRKRVHHVSEDRDLAIELRVSLSILFGLAALAVATHVSIMLAGFTMGLAYAAVGEPRRLARQVFALTEGFFGPIFFVWLGSSLDLRDLLAHPSAIGLGLALGVCAVALHALGTLTRQPWPVAVATSAQLGVPVAAATMGTQLGVLGGGEDTALLLGALVTVAVVTLCSGPLARVAQGGDLTVDGTSASTG
ncbi:cation:proton antiporter [Arsenicicoccus piscis]|uniref:cation:proton antiporter n=1 Tax=Arsenicicoccus piscis TaxID=673954 RepID=UPI001F4D2DB9|nr:cation:proton antiporter [Arsenicicoccus piscis]MCH8627497.1 cation:proton antiporter [Arsenicicoccus piscis]